MKQRALTPVFTDEFPIELESGRLYVSMVNAAAAHLCCCGCGTEVVTPLSPTDWNLVFDGDTVSLHPSIGNWAFECRSHYWITRNQVEWAGRWSEEQIRRGRERDRWEKELYYQEPGAYQPRGEPKGGRSVRGRLARLLMRPRHHGD